MAIITLTQREREFFARYLLQDAESNELMVEQLKKLGPGGEIMIPKMEADIAAALLVAQKLTNIEEIQVSHPVTPSPTHGN